MMQKYLREEVPSADKYIEDRIANSVILPHLFTPWQRKPAATEEVKVNNGESATNNNLVVQN